MDPDAAVVAQKEALLRFQKQYNNSQIILDKVIEQFRKSPPSPEAAVRFRAVVSRVCENMVIAIDEASYWMQTLETELKNHVQSGN